MDVDTVSVSSLARSAINELDVVITLVRDMLQLFCGDTPQGDATAKDRLQQLGQQYKTHSVSLRQLIRSIALTQQEQQAGQVPQLAQQEQQEQQQQQQEQPPQPSGEGAEATEAMAAELGALKQTAHERNEFLFQLITQLREMLDTIVMWETFGRNLTQDTAKKHERK
jgi:hypothetical protein